MIASRFGTPIDQSQGNVAHMLKTFKMCFQYLQLPDNIKNFLYCFFTYWQGLNVLAHCISMLFSRLC